MVLTFPLATAQFADLFSVESAAFNLRRFEEMALAGSGEWLTAKLAPDLWSAELRSTALGHAEAGLLRGRLAALGSTEAFYLHDPARPWPQADPEGTIYGASTPVVASVNADRKRLAISGLPANYVITDGDMMAISYDSGSRRALVQALETIAANGSGTTAQFEVRPLLRPAIAGGDGVSMAKPAMKARIVPGSDRIETVSATTSRVIVSAMQTLGAD